MHQPPQTPKGDYEPLVRCKITISETGRSPTEFFEEGTKRRLTDEEISNLDWRDYSFNVLLRISSAWLQGSSFGPIATPEAIVVKAAGGFPEALDSGGRGE